MSLSAIQSSLKEKPFRTLGVIFGALALAHALLYAFTGLHLNASASDEDARAFLLFFLHAMAIAWGGVAVASWSDNL